MPCLNHASITKICQDNFPAFFNDCSGFVKCVAQKCGVVLTGNANDIVDYISTAWERLPNGTTADTYVRAGKLVIAGASAKGHGHVVVVVAGPMDPKRGYPYAYWGKYKGLWVLGEEVNVGFTIGRGAINYAFGNEARKRLVYAATDPSALLCAANGGSDVSSAWIPWIVK